MALTDFITTTIKHEISCAKCSVYKVITGGTLLGAAKDFKDYGWRIIAGEALCPDHAFEAISELSRRNNDK